MNSLIEKAIEVKNNSYSPYSNFRVGACVLTDSGNTYTGTNIENASYSATMCAERVAIFKAISSGEKKIKQIAIVGDNGVCVPCGMCLQVMTEFCDKDTQILLCDENENEKIYLLKDLLPISFDKSSLDR